MKPKRPTVALVSLGCPKNLVDSEKMLALLAEGGCVVGAPMDRADVVVVNTCGFLSAAREESLGIIREAVELKRARRGRRVVVAGCLVDRDADKLFHLAPGIDAIVGVNSRDDILQAVMGDRASPGVRPYAGGVLSDAGRFRLTPRHTAYLRVAEGCSQRCAFCTIPAIRGPFRSKPVRAVLGEAVELIADGAVELNVIAQDTTAYGRDLTPPTTLARLLSHLACQGGAEWIRLLYAYPRRFTHELMEVMARHETIVSYVDIPLQHISDGVLKRMGRAVTRAATEKMLTDLRRIVPGVVIRTTFIVGFPGETEAEFRELLDFVKAFRFDAMGVFEFSPEEGTPAARMAGQVPAAVKARRSRRLMLAQQKIAFAANRRLVGRPVRVLVDGRDAQGRCVARSAAQAPDIDGVCVLTTDCEPGTFVSGTVVATEGYDVIVRP